jgi:hypothetical protein
MTDDYFSRLEAQLGELTERGAHLDRASRRVGGRLGLSGVLAIAASLAVVVLVSAVVLETGGARLGSRSGPPPASSSPRASSSARIDPALLAHYALARRRLRVSDRLPSAYALQAGASRLGLVLSAARRVSFGAITAWLIPGRRGACVTAVSHRDTTLAACGTIGPGTSGLSSQQPSAGLLIGIVSDRVRTLRYVPSAGAATAVAVHEGVFAASAPIAGRLIATTSSGPFPLAAPPPALSAPSPLVPSRTRPSSSPRSTSPRRTARVFPAARRRS